MPESKIKDCKYIDWCNCSVIRERYCRNCLWYVGIDSGYGTCTALPVTETVAWCRIPCTLYQLKG